MKKLIIDLFKYFGVAIVAAIVNIGMLYVLTDLFHINYLISNIVAFILGLITNYVLSKKYVFKESKLNKILEFIIYAVIGVIGLGIDTFFLWLFTSKIGLYYMLSKIITTGITFIWNFGARKLVYYITNKE
jgi:putative flippase GtrA